MAKPWLSAPISDLRETYEDSRRVITRGSPKYLLDLLTVDRLTRVGWIPKRDEPPRRRVPRALRPDPPANPVPAATVRGRDMPLQEQPSSDGADPPHACNSPLFRSLASLYLDSTLLYSKNVVIVIVIIIAFKLLFGG